ncbi:MAG: T9SS type B sorting domain-containing protein, partial [Bacteroidota bacterium]
GDKTQANQGGWDYWVVRVNKEGKILWDRTYGGDDKDVLQAVLPMSDGGFLLGGSSESGVSGDKDDFLRGLNDYWVIRIDRQGNIVWQKTIGGNWDEQIFDIAQGKDGTIYLVGFSGSDATYEKTYPSYGSIDYWVVAIDEEGNKLWDRNYGGRKPDSAYDVRINRDGNLVLGGLANSETSGSKFSTSEGLVDYWLVYITPDGEQIWDESYGASLRDALTEIEILGDGSILMAGHTESGVSGDKTQVSRGVNDIWLVKTSCDLGSMMYDTIPSCPTDAIDVPANFSRCFGCVYHWENGDTTQTANIINPISERAYKVTVCDINACTNVDSTVVSLQFPTDVVLNYTGENCEKGVVFGAVTGGNSPYLYALDTTAFGVQTTYSFLEEGNYTLRILDSLGCLLEKPFSIAPFEELIVELGDDPMVRLGDSLQLNVQTSRTAIEVQWRNIADSLSCWNCTSPSLLPLASRTISVEVEDEFGCVGTDRLNIYVDRTHEIYMPNSFTPNGDGINDYMSVYTGKSVEKVLSIKIFDRNGNLLFERQTPTVNDPQDGWDGRFRGELMPKAVYVCMVEVLFIDGYQDYFTSDVSLLR